MIARKIVYSGPVDEAKAEAIYDIVRKIEITGEIRLLTPGKIQLDLEGDPSMIKLAQHMIERRITGLQKIVEPLPFRMFDGLDFYR